MGYRTWLYGIERSIRKMDAAFEDADLITMRDVRTRARIVRGAEKLREIVNLSEEIDFEFEHGMVGFEIEFKIEYLNLLIAEMVEFDDLDLDQGKD
jgi:hypothetical protein